MFVLGVWGGGIDEYGHLAGLAAGFGLGKLFADPQPMNASERRTAYGLGWLAGLVVFACFALMILHYRDSLASHGETKSSQPSATFHHPNPAPFSFARPPTI